MLKEEAVRVRFLSYSEEEVRQRPFSLIPPGGLGSPFYAGQWMGMGHGA